MYMNLDCSASRPVFGADDAGGDSSEDSRSSEIDFSLAWRYLICALIASEAGDEIESCRSLILSKLRV
jgi:hypothetical protein